MQLSFDVSQYFNTVFKWIYLYTSLILFLLYKDIYNKEAIQCYIGVIVLITRACFFLDGYRLLTSFSHSFRFFPFCNYNGIYMNI